MKVVIEPRVYDVMYDFYALSCRIHLSLKLSTCLAKIERLERAMKMFADYAEVMHKQPYRNDWKELGYKEFVTEDFHFAYKLYVLPSGEKVLCFHDAIHSKLNYNPEDKN